GGGGPPAPQLVRRPHHSSDRLRHRDVPLPPVLPHGAGRAPGGGADRRSGPAPVLLVDPPAPLADEHRGPRRHPVHLRMEPVPVAAPHHHRRGDVHDRDGGQADDHGGRPGRPVEPGHGRGGAGPPASGRRRRPGPALVREGPDRAREVRPRPSAGLVLALALGLGACGKPAALEGVAEGDQVARPEWRVGDRWVFRRTTVGGTTSVVTYQGTAATADGYTLRLGGLVPEMTETWTPELHLRAQQVAGRAATLFEPAAMFFAWPLRLGKTWSQTFAFRDGDQVGQYVNEWRVGPVVEWPMVPAGSFYAVRI